MVRTGHDIATHPATPEDDLTAGLAVRPTDVEALLAGRIDLHELTLRAWHRCGLGNPLVEGHPAAL